MKRVLLLVPVLLVAATVVLVLTRGGSDDARPVAEVGLTAADVPFPGSTTPLPVPEVRIGEEPWRDDVPWTGELPRVVPTPDTTPRHFRSNCTACHPQ
jgi:hypothetical protein